MLIQRLKTICIEIDKTMNNENPSYMKEIFHKSPDRKSLRYPHNLKTPTVNQTTFGTNSISTLGPQIWNQLPENPK